jgi:CheY-like chemotaxis protein
MSKRILVVKDQEDNRQIIRDMLAGTENCALRAKSRIPFGKMFGS